MNLQQAIDNLYDAFADVPRPARLDGSPYTSEPDHLQRMVHIPLREIDPHDMGRYGAKAITTIGTGQDYLYYLPRLFELSSTEQLVWPDGAVILKRLKGNDCPLKVHHWDAIHSFLQVWWADLLKRPVEYVFELSDFLTGLYLMGAEWQPFLSQWDDDQSTEATHQLTWFIQQRITSLDEPQHFNASLSSAKPLGVLKTWLTRPETRQRLESAFFADPDGPAAQDISDALLYLG